MPVVERPTRRTEPARPIAADAVLVGLTGYVVAAGGAIPGGSRSPAR